MENEMKEWYGYFLTSNDKTPSEWLHMVFTSNAQDQIVSVIIVFVVLAFLNKRKSR